MKLLVNRLADRKEHSMSLKKSGNLPRTGVEVENENRVESEGEGKGSTFYFTLPKGD